MDNSNCNLKLFRIVPILLVASIASVTSTANAASQLCVASKTVDSGTVLCQTPALAVPAGGRIAMQLRVFNNPPAFPPLVPANSANFVIKDVTTNAVLLTVKGSYGYGYPWALSPNFPRAMSVRGEITGFSKGLGANAALVIKNVEGK